MREVLTFFHGGTVLTFWGRERCGILETRLFGKRGVRRIKNVERVKSEGGRISGRSVRARAQDRCVTGEKEE